jgi:hypothetical protein
VTTADVDGDGDADMIVTNSESDKVSVLKNKGNGTFAAKVDYATGDGPNSVTTADVDGDGDADMIVTNSESDKVSVLKNNGNGTFAAKIDYAAGDGPKSVTTADVNGDGDADFIVANAESNSVSVLLNRSTPTALEKQVVQVSSVIMISDPDGDASWNGGTLQVQVFSNAEEADSLFLPATNPGGSGIWLDPSGNKVMAGTTQIGTADAASVSNNTVWTLTFNANATNALVQEVARAMQFLNSSDTPGIDERIVRFMVVDNEGGTAFVDQVVRVESVNDAPTLTLFSGEVETTTEDTEAEISFADLLAKGDEADVDGMVVGFVVQSITSGTLRIGADAANATAWDAATNNRIDSAHQAYWTPDAGATGNLGAFSVVAVDDDGAESPTAVPVSVAVASVNHAPEVYIPALLSFAEKVDYSTDAKPKSVKIADVDMDGDTDLLVANLDSDKVSVFKNNGTGTFMTKVNYATSHYPVSVTSADVDGDGDADLLVANLDSDTVSVLKNNGNGTFAAKVDYATGDTPTSVTTADVDGDGDADMIVTNAESDTVSVLKNNGNGTFAAKIDYATGDYPYSVTSQDIDGDSDADVLVVNWHNNTVSVLKNTGNGTFIAKVDYSAGNAPLSVSTADVDGDGDADLLVANANSDTVSVLKNNGNGTFAPRVDYATGDGPISVTSADVDGDGDADVLVANLDSNTVSVLLNTSMPAETVALEQTAVPVSSGMLISDPDGDASWGGGTLQVQVFSNAEEADSLFLPDTNPSGNGIWLDPSGNKVMAGTTEIGAADAASVSNNTVWTLTFNANATNALVQEVARAVRFINSSDDPGTDDRTIRFTVTDNEGGTAHVDQAVRVEAVNDAPTGEVTITGTPIKGDTLTVDTSDLSDADGLGTFSYHWYADGVAITGATGETYTLTESEVGKTITVKVSYTDGLGTAVSVTSDETDEVHPISYTLDGTVTFWKSGEAVEGADVNLEFAAESLETVTDADGGFSFDDVAAGEYDVSVDKSTDESVSRAIGFTDALATLKMSLGMNPNRDGSAVSNYQYLAADANRDGKVEAGDALDILKMAIEEDDAPASEWLFVSETVANEAMDSDSVDWNDQLSGISITEDSYLDLIGVITGDVNGSWVAEVV